MSGMIGLQIGFYMIGFSDIWGISILSTIWLYLVPNDSGLGYNLPTSLAAFIVFWFLYDKFSKWSKVKLIITTFICIFLMPSEHFFCVLAIQILSIDNDYLKPVNFAHFFF